MVTTNLYQQRSETDLKKSRGCDYIQTLTLNSAGHFYHRGRVIPTKQTANGLKGQFVLFEPLPLVLGHYIHSQHCCTDCLQTLLLTLRNIL